MRAPRTVTIDGFVLFDADRAKAGDKTPFRWVRGQPHEYSPDYEANAMAQVPITFALPEDFHPTSAMVIALEQKRAAVQREFTARIAEINEQIGKLLAITNEVQA